MVHLVALVGWICCLGFFIREDIENPEIDGALTGFLFDRYIAAGGISFFMENFFTFIFFQGGFLCNR